MLSLIKRVFIFLTIFLTFGALGYLLDFVTGGRYGIRSVLTATADIASTRTLVMLQRFKRGWIWSPVLFVAYIISPVFFVFWGCIVIYDCYSTTDVYYDDKGGRWTYKGKTLTEADLDKNPQAAQWFGRRLATIFGGGTTGVLYQGGPIPHGWAPEHTLGRDERQKALDLNWRRMELGGNFWYAPPLGKDQDVPLSEWELSRAEE